MRWHLPLVGILLLIAAAFSSAHDSKKDKEAPKTANYYPLEVGNTWTYRLSINGKHARDITTRISKQEKFGNEMLARLDGAGIPFFEHLKQTADGVFRSRLNGVEHKPAVRLLAYPPKVGAKWQGEFAYGKQPAKHAYFGEVQKMETITVPAGKFETVRVAITIEDKGQKFETVFWFAPNVGIVKQTYEVPGTVSVRELEKFEQKK